MITQHSIKLSSIHNGVAIENPYTVQAQSHR